jgi:hypothetical protein
MAGPLMCINMSGRGAPDGEGARPRAPGKRVLTKGRIFAHGFKTSWAPRTSESRGRDRSQRWVPHARPRSTFSTKSSCKFTTKLFCWRVSRLIY